MSELILFWNLREIPLQIKKTTVNSITFKLYYFLPQFLEENFQKNQKAKNNYVGIALPDTGLLSSLKDSDANCDNKGS